MKKAEKAALKRDQMKSRKEAASEAPSEDADRIATQDDMAGYGFPSADEVDRERADD